MHWAQDADEYNKIVYDILSKHKVKKVVKSKSMLTEECHLNENLEKNGIEVVETDLGERILQMMKLAPSHIVMPALHVHREDIGKCFREKISNFEEISKSYGKPHDDPNDPTFLTYVARMHLRQQFAEADCGMTGANFGIAETGDVVVCTNEGNADMSTSIPKLHIVSMGIEKLIPDYKAMGVFQRFVARSGTGQETTVYTSHFRGPRPGGEMHIVLVDNGRSDILGNPEHWQTLKCMRCGACMNTCPVYRRSAGYSYTYFIPGPIGINLGMLRDKHKYHDNVSACSLCCSCDNVCPVKVDLSSLSVAAPFRLLEGIGTDWKALQMGQPLDFQTTGSIDIPLTADLSPLTSQLSVCISVVPMWPVASDRSNRFLVSLDGSTPQLCENKFTEWSPEWKLQVLENRKEFVLTFPLDSTRTTHVLTLTIVDPGQIIQKITY